VCWTVRRPLRLTNGCGLCAEDLLQAEDDTAEATRGVGGWEGGGRGKGRGAKVACVPVCMRACMCASGLVYTRAGARTGVRVRSRGGGGAQQGG
jgi:hypothetical protein